MRSKENGLAMKAQWIGGFLLFLGVNAIVGTQASADDCEDEEVDCIVVTAPRVDDPLHISNRDFRESEMDRQDQERLKAEVERERQFDDEEEPDAEEILENLTGGEKGRLCSVATAARRDAIEVQVAGYFIVVAGLKLSATVAAAPEGIAIQLIGLTVAGAGAMLYILANSDIEEYCGEAS